MPSMRRNFAMRLLVALTGLLTGLVSLHAQREQPLPPPPEPLPVKVRVELGDSVEIQLRSSRRSVLPLKFLLRSKPHRGSLSEIVPTSRTTATVIYTPSDRLGTGTDVFTYALQAPNTAVSVPARVEIEIVEPPGRVNLPKEVEFPSVALGDVVKREITVKNVGRGRLRAKVEVPEPWSMTGDPWLNIDPGKSARVGLEFRPVHLGKAMGEMVILADDEETRVSLQGSGIDPLELNERKVMLGPAGDESRKAVVLRNAAATERVVSVNAPEGVDVASEYRIPAGEEVAIEIGRKPDFSSPIDGDLLLESQNWSDRIQVTAPGAPPRLVVQPAEQLRFEEIEAGQTSTAELVIRNEGGSTAWVECEAPEDVVLQPDPHGTELRAGEEVRVQVAVEPREAGSFERELKVGAAGQMQTLRISAVVRAGKRSERIVATPEKMPAGRPVTTEEEHGQPQPLLPRERYNDVPPVEALGVLERTRTSIKLVWKRPHPEVVDYRVERRVLNGNAKGEDVIAWKPLEDFRPRQEGDHVFLDLRGLRAGEVLSLRIQSQASDGTWSRPSDPFRIELEAPRYFRFPWWVLWIVAAGGVAWFIHVQRRRHEAHLNAEIDRIVRGK